MVPVRGDDDETEKVSDSLPSGRDIVGCMSLTPWPTLAMSCHVSDICSELCGVWKNG